MQHWHRYAVAVAVLVPTSAVAQDLPLIGAWCSMDQTETMFIEKDGVGMNEHTVCDVETDVSAGLEYQTTMSCRNVYFNGDETVEAFPETLTFSAVLSADEVLSVLMRDETKPFLYARCSP